jgi:hypothetical protein
MEDSFEENDFSAEQWIGRIIYRLRHVALPVDLESFCISNSDLVPWHIYAKNRRTPAGAVKLAIYWYTRKGRIKIKNGLITHVSVKQRDPRKIMSRSG